MKKKGFIITLICTMLLTAGAGIVFSVMTTRDGSGKLPSLIGGTNSASSAASAQSKNSAASSAESAVTESGKTASAAESREGAGKDSGKNADESTKGTESSKSASAAEDVSGSEDASGSEDVSGSEDASGAEDVSGANDVSGAESVSGTESAEDSGLSTATKRYDPELLLADGRRAYDYTTAPEGSVFEYADFSAEDLVDAVAGVYQMAHDNNFQYGNSVTLPPCEDGFISCERLIARALWDLGITDQPNGGVQMYMEGMDEEYWFTRHGFVKVNDPSLLQRGDIICLQFYDENGQPREVWDNFVLTAYDPETQMCGKYDCGHFTPEGADRISAEQPFLAPLAEYGEARRFVCAFRLRERPAEETAAVG